VLPSLLPVNGSHLFGVGEGAVIGAGAEADVGWKVGQGQGAPCLGEILSH
jgi:hypothetical protein